MRQSPEKALLPAGLEDVLPPTAAHEATTVERLVQAFATHGYERVKPPLIEFEDALLTGAGAALAQQTFRLMDPVSHRMLGVRADMTTQVSRIAASRLARAPRPLRLCYAGQVLRVQGTQLRPERQFTQTGAELIGAESEAADVEVVTMAVEALRSIGVPGVSVDLNLPPLVGMLADALGFDQAAADQLREALDRKDAAAVETLADGRAELFQGLLRTAGPADDALARLSGLELPVQVRDEVSRLTRIVAGVREALPELALTVDPVEHRGFEYQTGVSFTIYAKGVRGELGRGGRYAAGGGVGPDEPATGFTLFMDTLMRALPRASAGRRVFAPAGADHATVRRLREEGWIVVMGLDPVDDVAGEAARLMCGYVLAGENVTELPAATEETAEPRSADGE